MASSRTIRVRFWLTEEEAAKLNGAVKRSGLSRESYIRALIDNLIPTCKPPPDYYKMMRQLHSISNNLNQIAQRLHFTGDIDTTRYEKNVTELRRVIADITKAVFEHRRLG
jgi:hypothetical protein